MGICPSSPVPKIGIGLVVGSNHQHDTCRYQASWDPLSATAAALVVHVEGRIREYRPRVLAGAVEAANPGYYLCGIENMHVGQRAPRVHQTEELQPGQIYFLLPEAKARGELALADLCELAVTACAAMQLARGGKEIGRGMKKVAKARSSGAAQQGNGRRHELVPPDSFRGQKV